jgi:hypothetical protein
VTAADRIRRAFAYLEEDAAEPHLLTLSSGESIEVPFEPDARLAVTPRRARYFRALIEADKPLIAKG